MKRAGLRVLVVEDRRENFLNLSQRLEQAGSVCCHARSIGGARELLNEEPFDLVLSSIRLPDGSARLLIPLLMDTEASLFCAQSMIDGCRWVPVVYRGRNCWGMAEPMRSDEFAFLLEEMVQQRPETASLATANHKGEPPPVRLATGSA